MWITDIFENPELKDTLSLLFNATRELERIQRVSTESELSDFSRVNLLGGTHPLEGSLGRIVDPFEFRADSYLPTEFHRGEE